MPQLMQQAQTSHMKKKNRKIWGTTGKIRGGRISALRNFYLEISDVPLDSDVTMYCNNY